MNTVTELNMAKTMSQLGAGAVLHRYMSAEDQVDTFNSLVSSNADVSNFYVSVSISDLEERLDKLLIAGVSNFCVDVANGHSESCIETVRIIKKRQPTAKVMAGNVCSFHGALQLADAGADSIRVGIGCGAVCVTRVVTGHGVPQLSSIDECARIKNTHPDVLIIADGGIRNSGDIVKALAIGADAVMLGSLLSGSSDTPGDVLVDGVDAYKYYSGMASAEGRAAWFDKSKTIWVPEGESTRVAYKGETADIVNQLVGGLRVGMSFAGANDIAELRENARWVKVSPAGLVEGSSHGKK